MSTSIDLKAAAGVTKALNKAGTDITFTVLGTQTYDPTTGITTEASPTNYTVKGVPPMMFRSVLMDKNGIPGTFFGTYIHGTQSFTPENGMKVTHDTIVYDITRVGAIYSGDDIALWEIEVNK